MKAGIRSRRNWVNASATKKNCMPGMLNLCHEWGWFGQAGQKLFFFRNSTKFLILLLLQFKTI